jgi:hypothetical protein
MKRALDRKNNCPYFQDSEQSRAGNAGMEFLSWVSGQFL